MDANTTLSAAARAVIDAVAYDEPYRFGRRPTVQAPFPFTDRQFGRLLVARGRMRESAAA